MSAVLLTVASCNSDFLDKKPLDKLTEDAVFNSVGLAESYVNSLYSVIPDPFQEGNIGCITDEGFFRYGGTSTRYIASGMMDPDNVMYINEGGQAHNTRTTVLNIWNRAYQFIRDMNYFLERVESGTEMNEEDSARLRGEVYFLRAWTYTNLVQRYAGVPIVKKTFSLTEDYGVQRDNFDDCIDFIMEDLSKAEELLPEKPALGRAGKDAVLALRSRLTLIAASPLFNDPDKPQGGIFRGTYSIEKWQRALQAAKAIVDRADLDGAYTLEPTYDGYWKNINSKENIWCKYFVSTSTAIDNDIKKAQLLYSIVYFNGWTAMEPTQAMVSDYEMSNGKKWFEEDSGYDPEHPFRNRDPRFYKSIATPFSIYANTDNTGYHETELEMYLLYENMTRDSFNKSAGTMPDYTSKAKHLWHASTTTGYELNKWYIPTIPITESEIGTLLYPWFRLAEMYLNYAECAYMTGDETTCRAYINKIRQRPDVMMPEVTESGDALWDRVINERRIEFAFEAMRYFDLRRWKLADFYENIPFAGTMAMILKNGESYDTVYRMPRIWDPDGNDKVYYTEGQVYDYRWLGKTYKIDYGDCTLGMSPTQKYFPEDGRNYLMPIPRNEITKSEGSIEQNPGY